MVRFIQKVTKEATETEAADKAITGMKNDKDPAGSKMALLKFRSPKQSKKAILKKARKLKVGSKLNLKAKPIVQSKKLKVKKHVGLRYETSNGKVASVSSKGIIKAKQKGKCNIYVYAQNGIIKKVKVVVK